MTGIGRIAFCYQTRPNPTKSRPFSGKGPHVLAFAARLRL